MRTAIVAAVLGAMMGVGVYIGISSLATQYALLPGSSNASQYACTPDAAMHMVGQMVTFTTSAPEGTTYYWTAPGGTASFVVSGPLAVRYAVPGPKTVHVFSLVNNRWTISSCSVQIK
jgi:hypothetical protein